MKIPARTRINNVRQNIDRRLHTRGGRNFVLYILCLIVAFTFWCFSALDEISERDYDIQVRLVNVPDSVVVVGRLPSTVNVVMKGKGTQFFRYHFTDLPSFEIDFRQYSSSNGKIFLSRANIDTRLRDIFGQNINLIAVSPDSISLGFTTGPGFRLPVKIDSKVTASTHSVLSGMPTSIPDSVTVYTLGNRKPSIKFVETTQLVRDGLSDTLKCKVEIRQPQGMRVVPDEVEVTVPVELLVSKRRAVTISGVNVPPGAHLVVYPAAVDISYLVPMRLSSHELPVKAYVDCRKLRSDSHRAKVEIADVPGEYSVVAVSQDSVEYVLEH